MIKDLTYYIKKFSPRSKVGNIGLNASSGAPNQPILLLSVIEMIITKQIPRNQIPLNAELIATFLKLWSYLEAVRKPDIGMPFFHLTSNGFWHFQPKLGFESTIAAKVKLRTPNSIRQCVEYAYFDEPLWDILQNEQSRSVLIQVLIDSWFSSSAPEISTLLSVNAFADEIENRRSLGGKVYNPKELQDEQEVIVRDAAFRRIILGAYNYRCAFCGLQIINSLGQNIVDGAHIKPFSQFYDDRFDNGLSLCKNHHWAFDRGWFTLNDDYTLLVSEDLREESPNAKPMRDMAGDRILLPAQMQYHPRVEAIRWHRENVFGVVA